MHTGVHVRQQYVCAHVRTYTHSISISPQTVTTAPPYAPGDCRAHVCVYIYMYIYIYIYIYIHTYTHIHRHAPNMYTHIYAHIHSHSHKQSFLPISPCACPTLYYITYTHTHQICTHKICTHTRTFTQTSMIPSRPCACLMTVSCSPVCQSHTRAVSAWDNPFRRFLHAYM
jgi:hypothetical protein